LRRREPPKCRSKVLFLILPSLQNVRVEPQAWTARFLRCAGNVTVMLVGSNEWFSDLFSAPFAQHEPPRSMNLPLTIPPSAIPLLNRPLAPAIPLAIRRFCTLHACRERRNRRIKTPDCATALSAVHAQRVAAACGARSRRRFYIYHRRRQAGDSFVNFSQKLIGERQRSG
jgi:hypothetical protein